MGIARRGQIKLFLPVISTSIGCFQEIYTVKVEKFRIKILVRLIINFIQKNI